MPVVPPPPPPPPRARTHLAARAGSDFKGIALPRLRTDLHLYIAAIRAGGWRRRLAALSHMQHVHRTTGRARPGA